MNTYLNIHTCGSWAIGYGPYEEPFAAYLLTPELETLLTQWRETAFSEDGLLAGVIADWLEDNGDQLTTLTPTKNHLPALIDWFRRRFADPERNQSVGAAL